VVGAQHPQVGGHPVAGREQYQVADDQIGDRYLAHGRRGVDTRPAAHGRGVGDQVAQSVDGVPGAVLLPATQRDADRDHDAHRRAASDVAEQQENEVETQ
jgi:hypothetical protein